MTLNLPIDNSGTPLNKKANAKRWPFLLGEDYLLFEMLHVEHLL